MSLAPVEKKGALISADLPVSTGDCILTIYTIMEFAPSSGQPSLMPLKSTPSIKLPDLINLVAQPDKIDWKPFRPGVEIFRIYGDGKVGPSAALIRFEPGGEVPSHDHVGFEHIFVLSGSQIDQTGLACAGTLIVNPPGTSHSISSETGCVVLAIYEQPVKFSDEIPAPP